MPQQHFIVMGVFLEPITFRRVEERYAPVHGIGEELSHLFLVSGRTIGVAHSHAAQADGRYFQVSKFSVFHRLSFYLAAKVGSSVRWIVSIFAEICTNISETAGFSVTCSQLWRKNSSYGIPWTAWATQT